MLVLASRGPPEPALALGSMRRPGFASAASLCSVPPHIQIKSSAEALLIAVYSPLVPTFVQRSKSFPSAGRSEPNIQFSRVAPLSIRRRVGVILDLCRRLLSRLRQGRPYLMWWRGRLAGKLGATLVVVSFFVGSRAHRRRWGRALVAQRRARSRRVACPTARVLWRHVGGQSRGDRQSSCAIPSRPPAPPGMPGECMRLCAPWQSVLLTYSREC